MSTLPERLSPVDAAWFRMDSAKCPADIVAIMTFDEAIDEGRLRSLIETRVLRYPRFKQRVVESPHAIAPPHWEDQPDFALDAHFAHASLTAAGDEGLTTFIETHVNEPTDFAISPWKLWLVDRPEGGSAIVTRIHHCMGDGFALIDILLSLADTDAEPRPARAEHARRDEHRSHPWLAEIAHVGRDVRDVLASLGHVLVLSFDPQTRLRGVPTGARRFAWTAPLPLARLKTLARARHGTVNDVLMAAISGAFRTYLLDLGEAAVPIRAVVPVNLRPASLPIDHEHGNWFGLVFLDLPLDEETEDARMVAIKRNMDAIKRSKEAIVTLGILGALGRSPNVVDQIVNDIFARKATVVVTNVPGPREPLELAGATLKDMWFWAPHAAGLACGASILSYAGNVRVAFRSDAGVVPDPEKLARAFVREIEGWGTA